MKLVLTYQSEDGAYVRIKSGIFRRRCQSDGTRVVSQYIIAIYGKSPDTRIEAIESYTFPVRCVPKKYRQSIEAKLKDFAAQRLNPDDLENAIDMFTESLLNEE